MTGYIRIRTPDDDPGSWTAQGDIVPGQTYTYVSGDVAVLIDWRDDEPTDSLWDRLVAWLKGS